MNVVTQTDKMLSRKEGGVGYLIFNNPDRHNAVSLEMWEAASGILDDFAKDDAIRVVVLTGAGGKAFVSTHSIPRCGLAGGVSPIARLTRVSWYSSASPAVLPPIRVR